MADNLIFPSAPPLLPSHGSVDHILHKDAETQNSTEVKDTKEGPKGMDPREDNKCAMRVVGGETKEGERRKMTERTRWGGVRSSVVVCLPPFHPH